jgi:hypothetical protein
LAVLRWPIASMMLILLAFTTDRRAFAIRSQTASSLLPVCRYRLRHIGMCGPHTSLSTDLAEILGEFSRFRLIGAGRSGSCGARSKDLLYCRRVLTSYICPRGLVLR